MMAYAENNAELVCFNRNSMLITTIYVYGCKKNGRIRMYIHVEKPSRSTGYGLH